MCSSIFSSIVSLYTEDDKPQKYSEIQAEIDKFQPSIPKEMKQIMGLEKTKKYAVQRRAVKSKLAISVANGHSINLSSINTTDAVKKYFG
ncbi:hypothetical protein [Moraxella sp.]|uniref:hypothetical protein n=1 Tax=Moraxella sp. TaxID=479 RepID=UPI0026DAAF9C|nr:hypothetical protein [Moraxella sp.]MDO4894518.1 hypothetical protein [Moraxella sp.]